MNLIGSRASYQSKLTDFPRGASEERAPRDTATLSFSRIDTPGEAALLPLIEPGLLALLRAEGGDNVRVDVEGTVEAGAQTLPVHFQVRSRNENGSLSGELVGKFGDGNLRLSFSGVDKTVRMRGNVGESSVDISHSLNAVRGTVYVGGMVGGIAVDLFINGTQNLQVRGSLGTAPMLMKVKQEDEDTKKINGRLKQTDFVGSLEKTGEGEYVLREQLGEVILTERITVVKE
ncbi:MAG: hypothetical protein FJX76_08025 [Armatimonadetes bacterium]|nr:hypothetical protein [Armatimonadota bacterium]